VPAKHHSGRKRSFKSIAIHGHSTSLVQISVITKVCYGIAKEEEFGDLGRGKDMVFNLAL
jgi:hypothetical protein